jgi:hypothetical protein
MLVTKLASTRASISEKGEDPAYVSEHGELLAPVSVKMKTRGYLETPFNYSINAFILCGLFKDADSSLEFKRYMIY